MIDGVTLSEHQNRQHHAYGIPTPPLGPSTVNSGIKKDLPCSSPGCPNFCSPRCGFCDFHCGKFHNGVHYSKSGSLRATIPDGVSRFLDLEKGHKLEWKMDYMNGKRVSIVSKSEKEKSDSEVQEIIQKYRSITKEDIELVAQQANVSLDLAEKALIESGNDLAKAIFSLTCK